MSTRQINVKEVARAVEELFLKASTVLRQDVADALKKLAEEEKKPEARKMLEVLVENFRIAEEKSIPICQDTGAACVFLNIGTEVVFTGGDINEAVDEGVKDAYEKGFLRKSVVKDPLLRGNTGTNTPAFVHVELVPGDKVEVIVLPKGFGSENKSSLAMLNPTAGEDAVVDFCVDTVRKAGPDACPPYVLGIGIGGTAEVSSLLAKKALIRPINSRNPQEHIARLEEIIEKKVRDLGIGVMGLGGISTVMGVNIETAPTHIAGLPVAVNISCHALRSARMTI